MPYLTQLAAVARRTGFPVTEVSGWKGRGHGPQPSVQGIVAHHTAGASGGGDYPSLAVVRDGRPGLDGPLSHFGLGRSGRIYVIAAGRCWHNAPSTSAYHTNSASLGIEAENDGRQAWPDVQLDAYKLLCAELCKEFGLPASRVKGHKEVNTEKPDPHSINMTAFRADVARLIEGDDLPLSQDDLKKIRDIVWNTDTAPAPTGSAPDNPTWRHVNIVRDTYSSVQEVKAAVAQLARQAPASDGPEVARLVLAGLSPEAIAEAIPDEVAAQVAKALADRQTA
ncbi:peptidoglycan recognition protein family protein [Actinomadura fibrosa]|uniref:N-acetylmuramoyl-L-alanine amidase n=1 Tax=Actinomadura fibrosa TaxID=111802 RepID=A0ABW2Y1J3_9ACTN|nr:peptidoglycan recognition family protein [Actinomadura fibrosa]